jgi:hypothetical protein
MIHYDIDKIQIVIPNENGGKLKTLDVAVSVTDLEAYRFQVMQQHNATHVYFRYESVNDRDKIKN